MILMCGGNSRVEEKTPHQIWSFRFVPETSICNSLPLFTYTHTVALASLIFIQRCVACIKHYRCLERVSYWCGTTAGHTQKFCWQFCSAMILVWPPLWSSGQSSRYYQIFWEVVRLERGPLNLVTTTEKLLGRNSSGSGLESREYGRGDPLRWPHTLYLQKLTLTSPTSGDCSVGIGRSRTKATESVWY
jgi:hypothetical protein